MSTLTKDDLDVIKALLDGNIIDLLYEQHKEVTRLLGYPKRFDHRIDLLRKVLSKVNKELRS